jgi:hypothetical protein
MLILHTKIRHSQDIELPNGFTLRLRVRHFAFLEEDCEYEITVILGVLQCKEELSHQLPMPFVLIQQRR